VEPDQVGLDALTDLVEADRPPVHLEQAFPLAEAAKAHELIETGSTQGKIVLLV
jgi:NADPH:quinone reductase-like Zn-dependent oxidoreductase